MNESEAGKIKARRQDKRLTQAQMAAEIGVTVGSVHRWESGKSIPRGLSRRQLQQRGYL